MERMKIRNPKIKKWRGLLILALIGAIITVAMEIYLRDQQKGAVLCGYKPMDE